MATLYSVLNLQVLMSLYIKYLTLNTYNLCNTPIIEMLFSLYSNQQLMLMLIIIYIQMILLALLTVNQRSYLYNIRGQKRYNQIVYLKTVALGGFVCKIFFFCVILFLFLLNFFFVFNHNCIIIISEKCVSCAFQQLISFLAFFCQSVTSFPFNSMFIGIAAQNNFKNPLKFFK